MNRKSKSREWFNKHRKDPYVQKAQQAGHRSRASFKLIEIQDKYQIIKQRNSVCDLGSAPGGWSELITKWVGPKGKAIACDLLEMETIADVDFIQGDFTENDVFESIMATLGDDPVDVVISDMAPNISGVTVADQAASMYLVELALDMASQVLKPKGSFLAKVFQGEGYDEYLKSVRAVFDKVVVRKPDSSRSRSREVYILGKGFKG